MIGQEQEGERPSRPPGRPSTRPAAEPTISMKLLWPFVRLLGTDRQSARLLFSYGVGAAEFSDPEARLPYSAAARLLDDRMRRTENPAIGLEAAELIEPSDVDLLEYACRSCATLRQGLECAVRYFSLLSQVGRLSLTSDRGLAKLTYAAVHDVEEPPEAVEFLVGSLLSMVRRSAEVDASCVQVWFRHSQVAPIDVYQRVLRVVVRFDAPCDAIVFPEALLDTPMVHADSRLAFAFRGRTESALGRLRERAGVASRVRELLHEHLASGEATMAFVGRRLGMSVPTLRGHLEAEGVTFSGVLDQVRRQVAKRQLRETHNAVWEVAMATGFSNAAAFHRAFKRYTGVSPAEYRERAHGSGQPTGRSAA